MQRWLIGLFLLALAWAQPVAAQQNFGLTPSNTSTQTINVTTASSSITLDAKTGTTVVITNTGANTAFVANAATATVTGFAVPAGLSIALNFVPGSVISAITSSSTTTLLVSKGSGPTAIAGLPAAATLPAGSATAANQTATQAPVAPATATATKSDLVGCQATSAAINPTTGQQAAVVCDLNNNVLVSSGGAPNFTTSQVTVTTGSTAVCAARALRRACTITAITGTQQIYCSGTTATSANGQLIPAVVGANFTANTTAAVNCIALVSSQTVSVAETF